MYGRVSEFGAVLRSPQSPRRALVRPIIPVHDAGLARVRVCLEGVGRGPAISSPHARRPDYSRTWCRPRARARVCLVFRSRRPPQSPRRTLVCPIIPVYDAGLARVRVCLGRSGPRLLSFLSARLTAIDFSRCIKRGMRRLFVQNCRDTDELWNADRDRRRRDTAPRGAARRDIV